MITSRSNPPPDADLDPYNAGLPNVTQILENARTLTSDNPNQQERLARGDALIADKHAELVALSDAPPIKDLRPAGTYLFRSVASVFGREVVAVIMTGMGDDGVEGLHDVRRAGGRIIAQDEASSVVFGMPSAAIDAGLVDVVLPLSEIAGELASRVYTKERVD